MNVHLTPILEQFVRAKVASGLYNNASEVVREALRLAMGGLAEPPRVQPSPAKTDIVNTLKSCAPELRKRGVRGLYLFGSVLHDQAGPDSDVDLFIDVAPHGGFDLVDLVGVKQMLEARLGRRVDVGLRGGLHKAIRRRVTAEAQRVF